MRGAGSIEFFYPNQPTHYEYNSEKYESKDIEINDGRVRFEYMGRIFDLPAVCCKVIWDSLKP